MYAYDQAHLLTKAIRESDEYKIFKKNKAVVESDPQAKKMFEDYRERQFEIQKLQVLGQPVPEEKMQAFKQLHDIVSLNSVIRTFLETEHRFGMMMADIQKILVEGLE
jgi:cell fate (sporulation/competence/biofilm development) regulator YlbF (YheA/YmcA/DUF963 family)